MEDKLYLECYAGISGDMTVAALLDLGADEQVLREGLASLGLSGYQIAIRRVQKSGLDACDFSVELEHENHDHDMEYLHGQKHSHEHSHGEAHEHPHSHEHEAGYTHSHETEHMHAHSHDHVHTHEHSHAHPHEHRGLAEITKIIADSGMSIRAKALAQKMFDILADAESRAHGVPREEVHFHEVGAVDSIVDIAAVAICLDNLNIKEVIVPVLYEGCGYIRCQHGMIPVPVPAVLNIADANGLVLHQTGVEGEFVTPTGAAIVAAICTSEKLPEKYKVLKTGIGAGKRNYERPSLLRAMLIREQTQAADLVTKMECNIDDCTGEALGFTMEALLQAGALEVNYTPVFMKKNRPAYLLTVLCREEKRKELEEIIFMQTSTIGIRRQVMERTVLKREVRTIRTSLGEVQVKICEFPGEIRYIPEYESAAQIARESGIPFPTVYRTLQKEAEACK